MAEESELVVAGDVVAEVMEREAGAEAAADEPRGWLSSLREPRRESGAEASEAGTEQAVGEAVGTVEFLGIWNEVGLDGASRGTRGRGLLDSLYGGRIERGAPFAHDRAMPIKFKAYTYGFANRAHIHGFRVAFSRLVDELVQKKAPSGILAISQWIQVSDGDASDYWGFSWAASPDDVSYQRHGFVGMESDHVHWRENIRFADFEGVVDDLGKSDQNIMAVYRVTLPRGGLDPDKWAGRPPPPAPEDLYTGPRDDGLLSTDEISGEYYSGEWTRGFNCCRSMTVIPHGPDAIEAWILGCCFLPPLIMGIPIGNGGFAKRDPGTNRFGGMTFSADGTVKDEGADKLHNKKRPNSRAFGKVETRDIAGTWCGCCPIPVAVPVLGFTRCTTKRALNEDQYTESGCCFFLCFPLSPVCNTHTRLYENGHATNGFARAFYDSGSPDDIVSYRDAGCTRRGECDQELAKKLC